MITDFGEVRSLPSTDLGVAFIVKIDDMVLYHAGDLAWWNHATLENYNELVRTAKAYDPHAQIESYESFCKSCKNDSEKKFKKYVKPLKGMHIDYAMLPLDPRNSDYGEKTISYYLELADITFFTPMHLWENYDYIGEFAKKHPEFCPKMFAINTQNIKIRQTIQHGYPYMIKL